MTLSLTFTLLSILLPSMLLAQENKAILVGDSLSIQVLDDIHATEYLTHIFDTQKDIRVLNIEIQESGWTGYSYMNGLVSKISIGKNIGSIPETIGKMDNLERIYLAGLGLNKLPESLIKLPRLEILDISFNALDIGSETKKLINLSGLRTVRLYGSSKLEIEGLASSRPNLVILYSSDDFKRDYVR